MKYKILFTKQMENDLKAIHDYIAFTLLAPDIAAGQLDRIEKAIMKLQEMLERYRLYEEEPWHSPSDHENSSQFGCGHDNGGAFR